MRFSTALLSLALGAALPASLQAQDASAWSGFYAGAQLSYGDGYFDWGGGDDRNAYGTSYGIHAGYLWTRGPWAYGAEIAYAKAEITAHSNGNEIPGQLFTRTAEIKAKLGYAVDQTLIYGILGYGIADWEEYAFDSVYHNKGPVYGIGFDFLVGENMMVGAEMLWRTLNDTELSGVNDPDLETVSLRVSYRF